MTVCNALPVFALLSVLLASSCSPMFGDTAFMNPFLNRGEEGTKAKNDLQKEILDIFGVEHRPRPSMFYRESGKEISARKYMIDLYNSVTSNEVVVDNGNEEIMLMNTTANDSNAANADTVVSFVNHGKLLISVRNISASQ